MALTAVKWYFTARSFLTFEYHLLMWLCSVTVDFGDNCPDTETPGFFVFLRLWDMAGYEGQHVCGGFRVVQQEFQSLFAHIFTLRLLHATKTLVYNVRFLYPDVYGRPKPFGKSFASTWKLHIANFRHIVIKFDISRYYRGPRLKIKHVLGDINCVFFVSKLQNNGT